MTEHDHLKIVFVLAHPDDEHIPFGLPAQLVEDGHDVHLISLTNGDLGSHTIQSRRKIARMRKKEFEKSGKILGATTEILGFSDGQLHHATEKAERKLLKSLRRKKPDVVVVHSPEDYHQDHREASEIGGWAVSHMPDSPLITRDRFFRKIPPYTQPVSFYEMDTQGSQTWQSATEDTGEDKDHLHAVNMILPITEEALQRSIKAFSMHTSQLGPRGDGQVGYIELAVRGVRRRGGVGLNFRHFGGYAFSLENKLAT